MARPPKLTPDQQREVCARYQAKERCEDLGREFAVHPGTILNILKTNGISRSINFRNLTSSEIEEVCRRYRAGETTYQLAEAFGVSRPAICQHLRNIGQRRRTTSETKRRYYCEESFFSNIDTQEKAYILGFIATDGCIKKNDVLSIGLQVRDANHLQEIAKTFSDYPVRVYREAKTPCCNLTIRSKQIVNDLANFGITPRKTYTVGWPCLRSDLYRHFVRGAFDGDGSFFLCDRGKLHVSFIGNEHLSPAIQSHLRQECGLPSVKFEVKMRTKDPDKIATFSWRYNCSQHVLPIVNWLYEGATIYLPRKRDKVLAHYQSLPKYRDLLRFG